MFHYLGKVKYLHLKEVITPLSTPIYPVRGIEIHQGHYFEIHRTGKLIIKSHSGGKMLLNGLLNITIKLYFDIF